MEAQRNETTKKKKVNNQQSSSPLQTANKFITLTPVNTIFLPKQRTLEE
jgi:hypothetical protein